MDPGLDHHATVLRAVLACYLDHLARTWHPGADSASTVASVLATVGRPIQPPPGGLAEVAEALAAATAVTDGPLALLRRRLRLEPGEELLVAAAWWSEVDPQLASVFGVLHDDGTRRHPTCGLLHLVAAPFGIAVPVHPRRLVDAGVVEAAGPVERVALTPTAREVLAGQGPTTVVAEDTGSTLPEMPVDLVAPLAHLLRAGDGTVVVRGDAGTGRHALVAAALRTLGLAAVGRHRPDAELRLLGRLGLAAPVIDVADADDLAWTVDDGPLVLVASREEVAPGAHVLDVAGVDGAHRRRLWAGALAALGVPDDGLATRLADQFRFTPAEVRAATVQARVAAEVAQRPPAPQHLWAAAQHRPDQRLGSIADRIEPAFGFDDLVLPAAVAVRLRELVAHVELRTTVLDDWGFRRRLPRGRGVAALFAGPSGTGKTTAAEAVACELGTQLFRIDLSRVVSKYIGETEQHLATAFAEAERSGALLLFDEADALFGKRTEVRDAHDRYANLEVSYLLQRVESFTGLVILSTNRAGNIDDAFLRRLRFVVRFERPDAAEREELWRRSFPGTASLAELDWARLARHDLAGGHIQAAALSAAFLAAGNGGVIDHGHLERAIAHEYEKLDRAAPPDGQMP